MITVDLNQDGRPPLSGAAADAEHRGRRFAHPGQELLIGNVTLDPNGGQVPWHNQEQEEVYFVVEGTGEMCLGDERRVLDRRPGGLHSARRLPPAHQHRRHAAADDLLLRPGGRRGPLAAGTRRHAAPGRRRGPAAAARRVSAMHGETD